MDYADIKDNLKVRGLQITDEELKDSLIELSLPLINWLEKRECQYKLIFSEKFLEDQ